MLLTFRRWAIPALVFVLALGPVLTADPAAADEIADKRAEAARLADDLERQAAGVSRLAEAYNQSRLAADEATERVAAAQRDVADTELRLTAIRARVRDQAVDAYMRGGSFEAVGALTRNSSVDDLSRQRAYLRAVVGRAKDAIDALRSARAEASERQAAAAAAAAEANASLAAVGTRRQSADRAASAQRATLQRVTGELTALVAAEQQRRAEEETRRELAARQARARATTTTTSPSAPRQSGPAPGSGAPASNPGAAAAVEEARKQIGKPYEWGADGPDSFDCSGLVLWSWRAGGRRLPHSAQAQYNVTTHIPLSDIAPGDLLFFGSNTSSIHHNGLYVGDAQMIEASQTGTPVRYRSIARRDLVGVGRVN